MEADDWFDNYYNVGHSGEIGDALKEKIRYLL